jgi:D-sedoheptulose 7-phosphate isomerase
MKNNKIEFINDYIDKFNSIILNVKPQREKIEKIYKTLIKYQKKNAVHIFGNGGSASIASHFSMDLTNNSEIKCFSYNDPSIITCYSNDFKFENWISRVIEKYGNKNDLLILISSSGKSKNMIKAVTAAKKKKFHKIITFTGFNYKNTLKQKGDLNIWINSKSYNIVENSHQFLLLLLVDMIKKLKK